MKKKLLVTGTTFPRWKNDTEPRFVLDLSKALLKYYDVTVLVPATEGAKNHELLEGVNVIRYHYFPIHKLETLCYPGAIVPRIKEKKVRILLVPFLFIGLFIKLSKMLPEYDIVHAHWVIPQGIIQSFFRKPFIITGHGGDIMSMNHGIIKKLKTRALKRASYVTTVSEELKSKAESITNLGNIEVISMGCNTEKFGKKYAINNYFKQNDKKVLLFVGRLAEKKGIKYLIDAMNEIDALLFIVGEGPLRGILQKQAEPINNKIRFLGAKTHEELKVLYASADIFVAPSITAKDGDTEGVPTVLMEAMASGLPCVASDSGGISSLISNGEEGFLVEEKNVNQLVDRLGILVQDDNLRIKLSEKARLKAEQYDYKNIAEKYAAVLKKALKN
ncbi:glycosyltransferase [Robinsoniella peoriensis]|uniref:glycosyltransferase n=1 Tax=Robinsoniella peoriensis TaxID=180332 RepID=UPI0005C7CEF6|nr:glycosyltransferase [Robinsoniella peoriensis]